MNKEQNGQKRVSASSTGEAATTFIRASSLDANSMAMDIHCQKRLGCLRRRRLSFRLRRLAFYVFPPRPADELQRRWGLFQSIFGRAKAPDLQWKPFIGVPLLAFFAADAVVLFYCKYRHETAYAAAFSRLFEMTGYTSPNAFIG